MFVSNNELMRVSFSDQISKRRVREHYTKNGMSSSFFCSTMTKKLRHATGEKSFVKPYQKLQRLITRLVELFPNVDDWVLDLFSDTCVYISLIFELF